MKHRDHRFIRRLVLTLVVFALLLSASLLALGRLERSSQRESLATVRDSIRRALVTCYAVEGSYPDSIDYLVANYGLAFDTEQIHVYYDAFASNIMPEVEVTLRGDDAR